MRMHLMLARKFLSFAAFLAVLPQARPESPDVKSKKAAEPVASWHFDGEDALGTWADIVEGPRPPMRPLFAQDNRAARFDGKAFLDVADCQAPSFKHGESLTFEFWISPGEMKLKEPAFLLAKGDPGRAGQADDNLNYALTVEKLSDSTMRVGICFAAEPDKPGGIPVRHQWWSGTISLTGLAWHHIAIPYTFGDPSSVMLFVNGRMQLFSGKWEKSTLRGPVQTPGKLRLGGAYGEGESAFKGRLDSLILYRGLLDRFDVAPRYAFVPPPTPVTRGQVEPGKVNVELCTKGIPGQREWPDVPPAKSSSMTEEVFGFFELPQVYTGTGVRGNQPSNTFLRASALVSLPKGKHRLLLRARGISRLVVDGRVLLDTPLMPASLNGHHLTSEQENYLDLGPDFRFAPPGNREAWCEFESTCGEPHLFVLETIFGTVRPGLGETVVAWAPEGTDDWQLLSPSGRFVPYTDEGWAAYEAERRANLERINTERRLAKRAGQTGYWDKRREAVRKWLESTPDEKVPALPAGMPAFNEVDHFIGARIAEAAPAYQKAKQGGPDFFGDIKPLLESRCYDCHRGAKAKGGLRLDHPGMAAKGGESGDPAILPGKSAASALIQRIKTSDEDDIKPPKG